MARVRCAGVLLDTRRGKRRELFAKKGGNTSLYPRPFRRTGVFLRDTAEPGNRRSNEEACLHTCFFDYLASNANLRNVFHFSGLLYHIAQRMPANERACLSSSTAPYLLYHITQRMPANLSACLSSSTAPLLYHAPKGRRHP